MKVQEYAKRKTDKKMGITCYKRFNTEIWTWGKI
jgi:hypothetical protein